MCVSIFSLFRPAYQGQCDVRISVWMRWKGDLEQRKIAFRVLNMNLDTTTPTGKLILNVLGSIAQFERELIKERMLVGIAKAKAEGKYKGRKPTAQAKADKVKQLRASGVGPSEIARQLSISRTSVFRLLTAT